MPAMPEQAGLRSALLEELGGAVRWIAAAAHTSDAAEAVHEARKGLRRAIALLALVAPALRTRQHREIRRGLQDARRTLSAARDLAVAPGVFVHLALPPRHRATARRVLARAAAAASGEAELRQLLEAAARSAALPARALEAALPPQLDWETLEAGLRTTYAAARRARREGKRSLRWFHAWRRRSKELGYQLHWVAKRAGPEVEAIRAGLDSGTALLSDAADLLMLRAFVGAWSGGLTTSARDGLVAAIDLRLSKLVHEARAEGRGTFHQGPRRFAARLARALRRDLATVRR